MSTQLLKLSDWRLKDRQYWALRQNFYIYVIFAGLYFMDMYIHTKKERNRLADQVAQVRAKLAQEKGMTPDQITEEELKEQVQIPEVWSGTPVPWPETKMNVTKFMGQAFYFSAITHSTVGYGDFYPLTKTGRMLVFLHVTIVIYLNVLS